MKEFFNENSSEDQDKDTAAIVGVQGRVFPVELNYLAEPCEDHVQRAIDTVMTIHVKEPHPGDILVFMPGREEIDVVIQGLRERSARFAE